MTPNEQTSVEAIKAIIDKRLIRTAERIGGSELTVSYNTLEVAEAIVALLETSPTVPVIGSLNANDEKVIEYVISGGRTIDSLAYFAHCSRVTAKNAVYRVATMMGCEGKPDCRKIADKIIARALLTLSQGGW